MNNHDVDQLLEGYREDFSPDVEAGLRQLKRRTGQQARVRKLRPVQWAAAAAVVVLVAVTGLWQLSDRDTVLANAGSEPLETVLPDGTMVVLQSGSELRYDNTYNGDSRSVILEGQAYFEVVSDKQVPFYVNGIDGARVRVTGTAFNLRSDADEFEVEVSEGRVLLLQGDRETPVSALQVAKYVPGTAAIQAVASPNLNSHAWRTGELNFEATPLAEVLTCIRNTFRVEVDNFDGENCSFPVSGKFRSTDAEQILENLARLGGGKLRTLGAEGRSFELSGLCD